MIDTVSARPDSDSPAEDSTASHGRRIETDVLVIGGGPAGSTTATLLALMAAYLWVLEGR